jgi:hypothetical protein
MQAQNSGKTTCAETTEAMYYYLWQTCSLSVNFVAIVSPVT